jgi:hypothetical protein
MNVINTQFFNNSILLNFYAITHYIQMISNFPSHQHFWNLLQSHLQYQKCQTKN